MAPYGLPAGRKTNLPGVPRSRRRFPIAGAASSPGSFIRQLLFELMDLIVQFIQLAEVVVGLGHGVLDAA